jgi:hypothetical protein
VSVAYPPTRWWSARAGGSFAGADWFGGARVLLSLPDLLRPSLKALFAFESASRGNLAGLIGSPFFTQGPILTLRALERIAEKDMGETFGLSVVSGVVGLAPLLSAHAAIVRHQSVHDPACLHCPLSHGASIGSPRLPSPVMVRFGMVWSGSVLTWVSPVSLLAWHGLSPPYPILSRAEASAAFLTSLPPLLAPFPPRLMRSLLLPQLLALVCSPLWRG